MFFIFIFGLAVGSFLNVCIYRLPITRSIITPPSFCPNCKTKLKIIDLIPVLSYIMQLGRCRYCGEKISVRYPIVELLAGSLFVLLFLKFSTEGGPASGGQHFTDLSIFFIFISLLIIAAFTDLEKEIIPDSVSILGSIPPLILSIIKGNPMQTLLGLFLGFLLMFILSKVASYIYKKDAVGEGDVKLSMMIGAYLGPQNLLLSLFLAILIGAIAGLILVLSKLKRFGEHVPFGPAMALGAVITIFFGSEILRWYLGLL